MSGIFIYFDKATAGKKSFFLLGSMNLSMFMSSNPTSKWV